MLGPTPEVEVLDEERPGAGVRASTRTLLRDGEAESRRGMTAQFTVPPATFVHSFELGGG